MIKFFRFVKIAKDIILIRWFFVKSLQILNSTNQLAICQTVIIYIQYYTYIYIYKI